MQSYSESRKRVRDVHDLLQRNEPVSDDDLVDVIRNYFVMTNTLEAAKLEMWAISPICARRPHLAEQLIGYVLRPLLYTGFDAETVIRWLQLELKENPEAPFRITDLPALEWAKSLPTQTRLIEEQLAAVEADEHRIQTAEAQAALKPYSRIPLDQIRFRYYWSEKFTSDREKVVVFIYFDDQESREAFKALTDTLNDEGIAETLPLFVVTGASYLDVQETYELTNPEVFADPDHYVQALWIDREKVTATIKTNEGSEMLYRLYTQELLSRSS